MTPEQATTLLDLISACRATAREAVMARAEEAKAALDADNAAFRRVLEFVAGLEEISR